MFFGALDEGGGDFFGVFVAGIVFGDDDAVGIFGKDAAANLASGRVAATGTAMNGNDFAFVGGDGVEDFFESIGGVSIVNNDSEGLTFIHDIHAALNTAQGFDAVLDLLVGETEFLTSNHSREGIIDIKFAGDFGLYFYITR